MAVEWIALYLFILKGVLSTLVVTPPNITVVIQGTPVTMSCSSDVTTALIKWYNNTNCAMVATTCPSSDTINNGFTLSTPSGIQLLTDTSGSRISRNLYFPSTQVSQGKNYVCAEYAGSFDPTSQAVAKLVVLAGLPTCTLSSSTFTCAIQYNGPEPPSAVQFVDSVTGSAFQGTTGSNSTTAGSPTTTTFTFTPSQTGTANCTVSFNQYTFTQQCPIIPVTTVTTTTTVITTTTTSVYNDTLNEPDSFYSWPWIKASIVISTVAIVVAACLVVLAAFSIVQRNCNIWCVLYAVIALTAVSMLLAIGIWIGAAICLSKLNGSSTMSNSANTQNLYYQYNAWLIGTLVLGLIETFTLDLTILVLISIVVARRKKNETNNQQPTNDLVSEKDIPEKTFGIGQTVFACLRFLVYCAILVWTIVVGENYKAIEQVDYTSTSYWTWQIFLITGACALVVAVIVFVLLWVKREKCCRQGEEDNFCQICTLIQSACRCQPSRPRRPSRVGIDNNDVDGGGRKTNATSRTEQQKDDNASGRARSANSAARRPSQSTIVRVQPPLTLSPRPLPVIPPSTDQKATGPSPARRLSQSTAGSVDVSAASKTQTIMFPMKMESPNKPKLEPIYRQESPKKTPKSRKKDEEKERKRGQDGDGGLANDTDEQRKERKKKRKNKNKESSEEP